MNDFVFCINLEDGRSKTRELLRKWTADGLTICYCSRCGWKYPAIFDVSDTIAAADALAVFEAHTCKDFPLIVMEATDR